MRTRAEMYCDIVSKMTDTYRRKNNDYGGSFTKLYDEFGAVSPIIKLSDKLERFKTLAINRAEQQVNDEAIADTLMDMANYAIMTVIELWQKEQVCEAEQLADYDQQFGHLEELVYKNRSDLEVRHEH